MVKISRCRSIEGNISIKHDLARLCFMLYTPIFPAKFPKNMIISVISVDVLKILKIYGNFGKFGKIGKFWFFFLKIKNYNFSSKRQIIKARGLF